MALNREDIAEFAPNPRVIRELEEQFNNIDLNTEGVENAQNTADQAIAATNSLSAASYVTLSLDSTLTNERVLTAGNLVSFADGGPNGTLTVSVAKLSIPANFSLTFNIGANTSVTLPASGTLATLSGTETLSNKTLDELRVANASVPSVTAATLSIPVTVNGVVVYLKASTAP